MVRKRPLPGGNMYRISTPVVVKRTNPANATASIENAISLATHLAERGDAIFFAPLENVQDELEMNLQFDREIESLLI